MTQTISVEAQCLVNYGRARYEDAEVYFAVSKYLQQVGAIPEYAWGQLPWSHTWNQRWLLGLEHRVAEAQLMSDHTGEHAAKILSVAANYTHTDVQVALTFDLQNPYLDPFVHAYSGGTSTPAYRPGGPIPSPRYGGPTVFALPQSLAEYRKLMDERAAGNRGGGSCNPANPDGIDMRAGVSGDALDEFVAAHGEDMLCVEYIALRYEPSAARPFTNHILPAWYCVPGIVRNRAELLYKARDAEREGADSLAREIQQVHNSWYSPGAAAAWFGDAKAMLQYLQAIAGEAEWLADQGIQAASLLDGLRNRYAELGHQRVKQLIELAQAALHAETDMFSGIGDCFSDPGKALVNAVQGFADMLLTEQRQREDMAIGLINIDEQRRREQVDPGTLKHDTRPYPTSEVGPDWGDAGGWKPNQSAGPIA